MRSLFDTNVLICADSADEPRRQQVAIALIKHHRTAGTAVLATQVLQEYTNVALRKLGLPATLVRERLAFYSRFEMVTTSPELIERALDLHALHDLSFCDAMIVQAGIASGCAQVLSEDMQEGRVFNGVRIVNPFRPRDERP
jgi:predicted nucleic acid-binding protein